MSLLKNKIIEIQELLTQGKFDIAEKKIASLLIKFPKNLSLLQFQSAIYIKKNDESKALTTFYKMADIKEHESIFNNIANLEKNKNNYDIAIKYYSKAISTNDKVPEIYFNLANCYSSLNETDKPRQSL